VGGCGQGGMGYGHGVWVASRVPSQAALTIP
jgi:hypothetical protein